MKKRESLTSSSKPILARSTQICASCLIRTKRMNDRDTQRSSDQNTQEDKEIFNNVEEASEYWRNLWESEGTGDRCASWLKEIRSAIQRRVRPPTEEDWDLDPAVAAKVLAKKKNWSAPGPDRLANFWWKRAESLHVGVATAFQAISSIESTHCGSQRGKRR